MFRIRTAMTAALVCVSGLVMPTHASAVTVEVNLGVDINGTLDGVNQTANAATGTLLGFLTDGVCEAIGQNLPSPLNTLACSVGMLHYTVHTVYKKPGGGEVVRDTTALALVPTPVDINADFLPDAIATVSISSLNQLSLQVDKLPFAPTTTPASVELVVRDPGNTTSSTRFAFGYDQRTSSIPTNFKATATLKALSPLQVNVGVKQNGANAGMTLIASMFQKQDNGTRDVLVDARLGFVGAPAEMGYDFTFGENHQHITTTATAPSTVTADIALKDAARTQSIHARIDKLPTQADVDLLTSGPNQRTVAYSGNAPIDDIDFLYQDKTGSTLTSEVTGGIEDLPQSVTVTQTGAKTVTATTGSGAIGLLEGGFASGQSVIPVPGTESGAKVVVGGGKTTIAARLRGLRKAVVDATGPYHADITSQSQPLHVTVDDTDAGRAIDATVANLPAHIDLKVDLDSGRVTENGFGEGIGKITLDATSTQPFFGRAKHLNAVLTGIPSSFDLKFAQSAGAFSASLDNPIGQVVASVDDGAHSVALPGSDSGLAYVDRPDAFAAKAKVFGLKSLSFSSDPTTVSVQTAGGHVFDASADVDLPVDGSPNLRLTAAAKITTLPSSVTVGLPKVGELQHVKYNASDAIDEITVQVTSPDAFFTDASTGGAAKRINATLHDIPTQFDLAFGKDGDATKVTMDNPVGQIDFTVDDGLHTIGVPATLAGPVDAGVGFKNVPGEFAIAGRIFGLRQVRFNADPVNVDVWTAGDHVFAADVTMSQTLDDSGNPLRLQAEVDKLPAHVTVGITKGAEPEDGTVIQYDGHGNTIDRVEAKAWGPLFFGKAKAVYAKVLDVPTKLTITAGQGTEMFSLDTFFQTIGHIELQALPSIGDALVAFPLTAPTYSGGTTETPDGIVYKDLLNSDLTSKEWVLALQLSGIRGGALRMEPTPRFELDSDPALAQKFGVNVQTQSEAILEIPNTPPTPLGVPTPITKYSGYVDKLAPNITVDISPTPNELIKYSAGAVVEDLFFRQDSITAGGLAGVTGPKLKVRLRDIPTVLNVCVASGPEALAADGGCARNPRPGSWPAAPPVKDDDHGDHIVVLNVDDAGTSNGQDPVTVDAYLCLTPKEGNCNKGPADDKTNGALVYVDVDNFKIHNLYFDAFVKLCDGLLVCGHIAMDTRGQLLSGSVKAFTSEPDAIEDIDANLIIPNGFHASNRYTHFSSESFLTGSLDEEYGSVHCPDGTDMPIIVDLLGGGTMSRDFAEPFFCG